MRVKLCSQPRTRSRRKTVRVSVPEILAAAVIDDDLNRGTAVPLVGIIVNNESLIEMRMRLDLGKHTSGRATT